MNTRTVYVAMSGGIDSSVAAALLQREGYHLNGITMTMSGVSGQVERAARVAAYLGISHEVVDVSEPFARYVIDPFCKEYLAGHTPNPCICCNQYIKFGLLAEKARRAEGLFATGHYARVHYDAVLKRFELRQGADLRKDQSYMLYSVSQDILSGLCLPLGTYTKAAVKELAAQWGLPVDRDAESQDICFIPDGDYAQFIRRQGGYAENPGEIVLADGTVVGRHQGTLLYTIGQRKGLAVSSPHPLFVLAIDQDRNRVIVGREEELYASQMVVDEVCFTCPGFNLDSFPAAVKIRYASMPAMAKLTRLTKDRFQADFFAPQKAITFGQAAVFYDRDLVLGGGTIAEVFR